MTPVQNATLQFIHAYIAKSGVSPSFAEISKHFGWASKSTTARVVDDLEGRGYLTRNARLARDLRLTDLGIRHVAAAPPADLLDALHWLLLTSGGNKSGDYGVPAMTRRQVIAVMSRYRPEYPRRNPTT